MCARARVWVRAQETIKPQITSDVSMPVFAHLTVWFPKD